MHYASTAKRQQLRRPHNGLLMIGLASLVLAPPALAWQAAPQPHPERKLTHRVAVFGADDRVPLPANYKDIQEKIGLLFNPSSRMVCTAFCVSPDTVATAGHCLFRINGESSPRIADFYFARNYNAVRDYARVAGHATDSTAQHVISGAAALNMRPPIDATKDWALVRLARPTCSKGVLPVKPLATEEIIAEAAAGRTFQVSYHRDFTPWKLAYAGPCAIGRTFGGTEWKAIAQDFADPDALLLHTCDTGGASSGSPILIETPEGPAVVGINVGTYVQSKVEMMDGQVTRRFKAETVANTGVSAAQFAAKLEAFRNAVILATPTQIRHLQAALREREIYSGPLNGTYTANLRAAIEAYEAAEGLPVTGFPTQALLRRLGGNEFERSKARSKS
jgi:V8-like Glu-specific endopeptidase